MADLKVYIPDDLEQQFKKASMETYGYGRGSISKAATEALQKWTAERETVLREFQSPREPVKALRGMLKHVRRTSVQLQHEAKKIRLSRALGAH
jgi:hypothetical protein